MNVLDLDEVDPNLQMEIVLRELASRKRVEEDREECKDMHEYVRRAWHVVEPSTPFADNWHIEAICEHLEAIVNGQIRNLLITMPPRHYKSGCVSVMFPTWLWGPFGMPHHKFLYCSYALTLSIRDALASRRLMTSDWYRQRWGDKFVLTSDQNAKLRYDNNKSGYRIASSVGGTATGEGGSIVCVDDAHNLQEINSEIIRNGVLDWWDHVMPTRINDPEKDCRIIVMQRGHHKDLAGHVIEQGGYVHLNLPAEYEGDRKKTVIGWSDPRKKKGELLWPARYSRAAIDDLKLRLGPTAAAAQLQQRPTPEEGGIFKRSWFRLWPADAKLPLFEMVIQSYDTAFTEKTTNDKSAGTTWGLFRHPKYGHNCILLLDAWSDWLSWPDVRKKVRAESRAKFGENISDTNPGKKVDMILIENKGSGITLIRDLEMVGISAVPYNPKWADKTVRAHASTPFASLGRVYLLASSACASDGSDQPVSWALPFLTQLLLFRGGAGANAEDDYVDTFTQMVIWLRDTYELDAPAGPEFPEDVERDYYGETDNRNPYAA